MDGGVYGDIWTDGQDAYLREQLLFFLMVNWLIPHTFPKKWSGDLLWEGE